ncbi:hypothetical protein Tco_1578039 [Tanacetum coccineum]
MNISFVSEIIMPTFEGRLKKAQEQLSYLTTSNGKNTLRNPYLIYNICGGAHEADECDLNKPCNHVCLSGGDIYDPSLLRFYHNDDIPPWGNETFENRQTPTPKPDAPTFAIITRSGITTHFPPYPDPSIVDDTDRTNEEGVPEGKETAAFHSKETPQSPTLYLSKKGDTPLIPLVYLSPLEWKAPENWLKPFATEPPKLELKELPEHLEYAFLQGDDQLPVSIADIKGIDSSFCTHKILIEDEFKPTIQPYRRVNPNIKEVVKKEVIKLLDSGLIYPISNSPQVSPVQVVSKKRGMTMVKNEKNKLIPQRTVTIWHVCIDYIKVNDETRKDHFPLPFIDQMLERLAQHEYYCFLDGFSGYFQIPITLEDQEKTTFTCPYGTFAYKRMSFGLCNAPAIFQGCMMAIFHELIEESIEVFMDDFSVFGSSFDHFLAKLEKMLKRCDEMNLVLNWENAISW